MDKIKGTGVASVTPFNNDKSVDYKGLESLLQHVINGGVDYLDHELFNEVGIAVEYMDYEKCEYPQLYGEFTPFVSALDLLANCGQEGRDVIAPQTVCWKDFINE